MMNTAQMDFIVLDAGVPPAPPQPTPRELSKQARDLAVAAIAVEVDGMRFDGDETSQNRMARAIVAMQAAGVPKTLWTLADNAAVEVTAAQLGAALAKAGSAQTALWALP
jgi:hypothetical protein